MKIKCLLVLLIILALFGCKANEPVALCPVDSLGWQENDEYFIGGTVSMEADKDNLYCLNANQHCVHVFNINTLESKGRFGSQGNGPGEFRIAVSFTVTESGINVYDIAQKKIEVFSKQFKYVNGFKTDKFLADIDSYNNEIIGLTDMRLPNARVLKIFSDRCEEVAEYIGLSKFLGYNPETTSILEFRSDVKEDKMYLTHMQVQTCCLLEKGDIKLIDCDYPEWAAGKNLQTMSIFATESGFLLVGSWEEDIGQIHSFAFEFSDEGKLLKEYKLGLPMNTGILCSCFKDNNLYAFSFNQTVYKFMLE